MSDLKLFRVGRNDVIEIRSESIELEKSLQTLIEGNLETMLGVRFLASEYLTGKTHGGRIDTLGLDENSCPVILSNISGLIERKRDQPRSVLLGLAP